MRYLDFKTAIEKQLRRAPAGLTWAALKRRGKLPYSIPCPEWVKKLEHEIGLLRERTTARTFTWKLPPAKTKKKP